MNGSVSQRISCCPERNANQCILNGSVSPTNPNPNHNPQATNSVQASLILPYMIFRVSWTHVSNSFFQIQNRLVVTANQTCLSPPSISVRYLFLDLVYYQNLAHTDSSALSLQLSNPTMYSAASGISQRTHHNAQKTRAITTFPQPVSVVFQSVVINSTYGMSAQVQYYLQQFNWSTLYGIKE